MNSRISTTIIVLVVVFAGVFLYRQYFAPSEPVEKFLSAEEAGEKAIAFANDPGNRLLVEGNEAELLEVTEESGVYKIKLKIGTQEYESFVTKDGRWFFPQNYYDLNKTPEVAGEEAKKPDYPTTVGDFLILDKEICDKEGRPLVYFFGHSGCPHCQWEEPVVKKVMALFGDLIAFHNNMDTEDDREVFEEYAEINSGSVPFLVLGCKYVRVGSGEKSGEEEETKVLTAIACKLTEGKPEGVCGEVKDLVESIE